MLAEVNVNNTEARLRSMHGESNWRSKLLDLCATENVKKRDLYALRAFVRPFPTNQVFNDNKTLKEIVRIGEYKNKDFDIDDLIILFCEYSLEEFDSANRVNVANDFRMLCRVLLKYDWIVQRTEVTGTKKELEQKIDILKSKAVEGITSFDL